MAINNFPTSSDIYLEAKGKRIAVVQSYKARAVSSSTAVEAFGEREPVATIEGPRSYVIELTRLYATDSAITDGLDFYDLTDFSLVIVKPNRRTVYTGCRWAGRSTRCCPSQPWSLSGRARRPGRCWRGMPRSGRVTGS